MSKNSVLIKCRLQGELAKMYFGLRKRGVIKGSRDIVIKGVQTIYDETLDRDFKRVRVRSAERYERT
ncbi:MAG: hypothetical protein ACOC6N_00710 [archaeon]